jgi:hypothetical protein
MAFKIVEQNPIILKVDEHCTPLGNELMVCAKVNSSDVYFKKPVFSDDRIEWAYYLIRLEQEECYYQNEYVIKSPDGSRAINIAYSVDYYFTEKLTLDFIGDLIQLEDPKASVLNFVENWINVFFANETNWQRDDLGNDEELKNFIKEKALDLGIKAKINPILKIVNKTATYLFKNDFVINLNNFEIKEKISYEILLHSLNNSGASIDPQIVEDELRILMQKTINQSEMHYTNAIYDHPNSTFQPIFNAAIQGFCNNFQLDLISINFHSQCDSLGQQPIHYIWDLQLSTKDDLELPICVEIITVLENKLNWKLSGIQSFETWLKSEIELCLFKEFKNYTLVQYLNGLDLTSVESTIDQILERNGYEIRKIKFQPKIDLIIPKLIVFNEEFTTLTATGSKYFISIEFKGEIKDAEKLGTMLPKFGSFNNVKIFIRNKISTLLNAIFLNEKTDTYQINITTEFKATINEEVSKLLFEQFGMATISILCSNIYTEVSKIFSEIKEWTTSTKITIEPNGRSISIPFTIQEISNNKWKTFENKWTQFKKRGVDYFQNSVSETLQNFIEFQLTLLSEEVDKTPSSIESIIPKAIEEVELEFGVCILVGNGWKIEPSLIEKVEANLQQKLKEEEQKIRLNEIRVNTTLSETILNDSVAYIQNLLSLERSQLGELPIQETENRLKSLKALIIKNSPKQ